MRPTQPLAYTAAGFELSDTAPTVLTGALARAHAGTLAGEQAGAYAITQGTLTAGNNYAIRFTRRNADDYPRAALRHGQSANQGLRTDRSRVDRHRVWLGRRDRGWRGDRRHRRDGTHRHPGAAAGETAAESPYVITQGTLAANSNYTIQFIGSTLFITPATPILKVNAPGGAFTGSPIAAQATVTGVSGTAAASLEGVTPTLTYYVGSGTSSTNLGSAPAIGRSGSTPS